MLSCFLVIALTYNGETIARSFSTLEDVPAERAAVIMAIAAGRTKAATELALGRSGYVSLYGYSCDDGAWNDHGLAKAEVFQGRRRG